MQRLGVAGTVLFALSSLVACGDSPTGRTPDWIEFASITPAAGTVLRPGQSVTFTASLRYTFALADAGQVTMMVMDQTTFRALVVKPQPTASIPRGTGMVTLTDTVVIPASGTSGVFVLASVAPVGAITIDTVAEARYPVQ